MSKKNIRKHGRRKEFSTDISSLDEIPSTNTSSNDATGIESVGVKAEAADITGAELGGVNTEITEKTAAADSAEELPTAVNSCNRQSTDEKKRKISGDLAVRAGKISRSDFAKKLRKMMQEADEQLEYFRQSVSEMLDSGHAVSVNVFGRIPTRIKAARRAHERFRRINWMRRRLIINEKAMSKIRDSQFSAAAETVANFEKRTAMRFDSLRMKGHRFVRKYEFLVDSVIQYWINHRKKCTIAAGSVMMFMMAFAFTINAATVYDYSYHGTQLGTVKDKTEIEEAVEQVPDALDTNVNVSVDPESDVTYTKQLNFSAITDTAETAADKIANADNLTGAGFSIIVDGKTAALVDSQETAEKILEKVKLYYCTVDSAGNKLSESVSAAGNSVSESSASSSSTEKDFSADQSKLDAFHSILTASTEDAETFLQDSSDAVDSAVYESQTADAKAQGAADQSSSQDEDTAENDVIDPREQAIDAAAAVLVDGRELEGPGHPMVFSADVAPDDLIFDEEVKIEPVVANVDAFLDYDDASEVFVDEDGSSKLLTVSTSEIQIFSQVEFYETVYEDDPTLYKGETKVKTEGVNGESRVTARIFRINGEEVNRTILSEVETTAPVDQVILRGTKEKPSTEPTGDFIWPTKGGRLSSSYGSRWGRQHKGIDIAAPYGTSVVASDGGTVVYAGYNSSGYGNLIKIDHGNGYMTYYAHNSSLCVSVGDKVAKGQLIAKVGSTGRSTGNHCHFEIRKNGTPVNPYSYVG